MLDLRQFQVLRAIAREGSLAAASRRLHYGQPTISHHLNALEAHLRATLVDRGPRGAELTDMGQLLLERVEVILDLIDAAEDEVRDRSAHGVATLRIGTFPSAGVRLLPTALRRVLASGTLRVELDEAEPYLLVERLAAGSLHCALLYDVPGGGLGQRPGMVLRALCQEPYRLVLAEDHRLSGEPVVDLRDLRDEGWIFARDSYDPGDRAVMAACEAIGFRPRVALRSDDYAVIQGFVAAGIAVAAVPEKSLDPRQPVVTRPTAQPLGARCIHFASIENRRPPVIRLLEQTLADVDW